MSINNPQESEFQKQSRSIFEGFSESLRSMPTIKAALIAAAPAAVMIMGGVGLDAHENMQLMDTLGHEGFQAFKEAGKSANIVEAVKTALVGGHQTIGANTAFLGMAAAPVLPALAAISKGVTHALDFFKGLSTRADVSDVAEIKTQFNSHFDSMNAAVERGAGASNNFAAFNQAISEKEDNRPTLSRAPKLSM